MRVIKVIGGIVGVMILLAVVVVWWTGRPPRRPSGLSAQALYIERGTVPFKISSTGEWLDCWFDESEHFDRCKLTDVKGKVEFEDVFLPYEGQSPIPKSDLILDARRTGNVWTGTHEKGVLYPVVYLANGAILIPRSDYEKAKQTVDWVKGRRRDSP